MVFLCSGVLGFLLLCKAGERIYAKRLVIFWIYIDYLGSRGLLRL